MRKGSDKDGAVHESVGNVLTDLGLPNGREGTLKVEIADAVSATIRERGLTQAAAGKIIGADQGTVSELLRGRRTGFSLGRLLVFLVKLGCDVDVTISPPHEDREGSVRVKSAAGCNDHGPFQQKGAGRLRTSMLKHIAAAPATEQI